MSSPLAGQTAYLVAHTHSHVGILTCDITLVTAILLAAFAVTILQFTSRS